MKRLLALVCALVLPLSGCAGPAPAEDGGLHILATTYPVYLFTTAVTEGAEGVEVDLLVNQPTSCLHDYTLTVTDMKAVQRADVIVMNGAGLEDFLADALAGTEAETVDCSAGVDLLPAMGHEGHHHDTVYDPHFWLDPAAASVMLDNIAAGLGALDGTNRALYDSNRAAAQALLPGEDPRLEGLACPYLITFHDGFQYFARANGLTILKAIEEEEGATASAAEIKEIARLIRAYRIPSIFTETNGSAATAGAIARETGCGVRELTMLMSGDGVGMGPYLEALEQNRDTIAEALS